MSIFGKLFKRGGKEPARETTLENSNAREMPLTDGQTYHYLRVSEKGGETFSFGSVPCEAVDIETWRGEDIRFRMFTKCEFIRSVFMSVRMYMTVFEDCVFTNTVFDSVTLENCVFRNCRFKCEGQWPNKFAMVLVMNATFDNCKFENFRFETVCTRSPYSPFDLSGCRFTNVKTIGCDVSRFVFPEGEEARRGMILSEPMAGYKFAVPIMKDQYDLIVSGANKPSHFIDVHGLNCDIRHPDSFHHGIKYEDYMCAVELEIPVGAVVMTADNRNFRANRAVVKSISGAMNIHGVRVPVFCAVSKYDNKTMYVPGEEVVCPDFPLDPSAENVPGIYFTLDKPDK